MFALLMFAQAVTAPAPRAAPLIVTTPVPIAVYPAGTDAAADARCIVVFGFIGSRATGDQAEGSKRAINFFLGKLRGRDAQVDIAATVTRAAEAARTAGLNARAEAERCGSELDSAGRALGALRGTTPSSSAPPPGPLRDVPRVPTPGR